MLRRAVLKTIAAGFPAILKPQNRRPNVIFMMTDDQRADAMSCAGNKILKTPHMDRIAEGGVRFTEGFVTIRSARPAAAQFSRGYTRTRTGHHQRRRVPSFQAGRGHLSDAAAEVGLPHRDDWQVAHCHAARRPRIRSLVHPAGPGPLSRSTDDRQRRACSSAAMLTTSLPTRHWRRCGRGPRTNRSASSATSGAAPVLGSGAALRKMYEDIAIPEPRTFNTDLSLRPPASASPICRSPTCPTLPDEAFRRACPRRSETAQLPAIRQELLSRSARRGRKRGAHTRLSR